MHSSRSVSGGLRDRPAVSTEDPNTARMIALLGGHELIRFPLAPLRHSGLLGGRMRATAGDWENDRDYFDRRSREERWAAAKARGVEARRAHEELAALYARFSEGGPDLREESRGRRANTVQNGRASRTVRQDDLLDDALEETFPASDPVSVAFIR